MSISMIFRDKKFWPLFWTQFFGALNDNYLKNALVVLIAFKGIEVMGMDSKAIVSLAGGIFIIPFFLFSPLAGQLSDKIEKSKLVRYTKLWELLIMLIAGLGFYTENYILLLFVLFLMGTQSTFFGPVKYSVIPELVDEDKLLQGNAYIELGTFLAILLGTIGGGIAVSFASYKSIVVIGLITIALLGLLCSYQFPKIKVANANLQIQYNPIPTLGAMWRILREKPVLFNSVLGISWFWFFGAGILSILPIYCKEYLGVNEQVVTIFLAMFTIGIAVGSIVCEKLSFKRVEIGLVPFGAAGLTLFLIDLFFVQPTWTVDSENLLGLQNFLQHGEAIRLLFDFFCMSIFGGIFIVPLYTLLQERSRPEVRSQVIAGNNVINAVFMVVSSVTLIGFYAAGLTTAQMFLVYALMNLVVALYIFSIVPDFALRFLCWILVNILYKLRITGEDNIPKEGPLILACNHITFVDWLIISGACRRPARFIMYYKFFDIPVARFLMKQARVIPIAGAKEDPVILQQAFDRISAELEAGEVVCIFPEGTLTKDGNLCPFRPGIQKILDRTPVPVVPLALRGLWGSIFSRSPERSFWKRSIWSFWRRVELEISAPIQPAQFKIAQLEKQIDRMSNQT